ncbi:MAG: hypothetical protein GC192_07370 [Bacteroidetes bacterium]|nr:hypothetical protein [Bacteroidota bacterium]
MSSKKPSFKGSQQNLYSLARKAWAYCLLYIADIAAKHPKYTIEFIEAQQTFIDSVEAMPDIENRNAIPAQTYEDMQAARKAVLNEWQFLKGYVMDAYTGSLLRVKLAAAGQNDYEFALRGSLDHTTSLINSAKLFMTENASELDTLGNMPASFHTDFTNLANAFLLLRTTYDGKNDMKLEQSAAKRQGNETILKALRPMLRVGKRTFVNDRLKWDNFVYANLLNEVRGHSPSGLRGFFKAADTNMPLEGVHIRAVNTEYEAISAADGHYFLEMASGVYNISISAEGYNSVYIQGRKIDVGVKHWLNLSLEAVAAAPVVMVTKDMLNGLVNEMPSPTPAENGVAA